MPEYLAPGVYVEETSFRPKSIEGVSTSTTAFVGPTRRGPLNVTPQIVTSIGDFERVYGGLANLSFAGGADSNPQSTNYLAHAVTAFFNNGGGRLFVSRVFMPRTDGAGSDGVARSDPFLGANSNNAADHVRFMARAPGSGYNCTIVASMKTSKTSAQTINNLGVVPLGSIVRTGGITPARPAQLVGGLPPFRLSDGNQLALAVGGNNATITFNGTRAEVVGDAVADPNNVAIPANTALTVTIGDRGPQTINLPNETRNLAAWAALINERLTYGYARVTGAGGNQLAIGSDQHGKNVQVTVSGLAELGFNPAAGQQTVSAAGGGNVGNLDAVTISELNQLLSAANAGVQASQSPTTNQLLLTTTAAGADARLQVANTTDAAVRNALGLPVAQAAGAAGDTVLYYRRGASSWTGGANGTTTLDTTSADLDTAQIVTVTLDVTDADGNETVYDDLGLSPLHPRWMGSVLSQSPTRQADALLNPIYVEVGANAAAADDLPLRLRDGLLGATGTALFIMSGGNDGAEPPAHTPTPPVPGAVSYEQALSLLEKVEDVSILAAPGHSSFSDANFRDIQQQLLIHAERMRYRIAVLDTPPALEPAGALDVRSRVDSRRAALYYPWVVIGNPAARPADDRIPKEITVPPSGFICGIYARSDVQRGVWKAPANEPVLGALRFEREISFGEQQLLNPQGVNCLRFFYGRGYLVWGARTISSDPEWKYVPVRRYFNYLERSIDVNTQWAVFEPNGEALWANIQETVSAFLYNEWRSGALLGSKPEEAFFVRCDRSTMTQNDLDNGRLICLIGVAVLKPAEFVIFRIGQKTADARQ